MLEPFLGQIELMPFNFAPQGWAPCNGQLLPIRENQALFSLLGTTYGGDGKATFALPDLQGRVPVGAGRGEPGEENYYEGRAGGEQAVGLLVPELPMHTHSTVVTNMPADATSPAGSFWASKGNAQYADPGNPVPMSPMTIAPVGGGMPHNNLQPYLVLNYYIALQGIYPARG